MFERLKLFMAACLLVMVVVVFLSVVYVRGFLGFSFSMLLIVASFVFGYVVYKKGYVKKAEKGTPNGYFSTFIVKEKRIVCGGLVTGVVLFPVLAKLYGPFSYEQSLSLFFVLFAIGAAITYMLGRKLRWY